MIGRKALSVAAAAILLGHAHVTADTPLFVVSRPLSANVILDGVPRPEKTPVLLRLPEGNYGIEITKPGYPAVTTQVTLHGDAAQTVELDLETGQVQSLFLTELPVVIGGIAHNEGSSLLRVPFAGYEIRGEGDALYIDPVFPRQALLDVATILFPVAAAFTVGAVIAEVVSPERPSLAVSPGIVAGSAATVSVAGLRVILQAQRRAFQREFTVTATDQRDSYTRAAPAYARGEDLLAAGDLDAALEEYGRVIGLYTEAPEYPLALYKAARIFSVQGRLEYAAVLYRHILAIQQHPEVYDKAAKQLADRAFLDGNYETAVRYLDTMVHLDPILAEEDAATYRQEIIAAWSADSGISVDELERRVAVEPSTSADRSEADDE